MSVKIIIIKLGYSETLDSEIGRVPSLGDVLRTTPILFALKEKYPDSRITWLVSEEAEPLLNGNNFINRILIWDEFVPFQLMREKFDILINLEKIPGVCALADMIDAWIKYGFRFDSIDGTYHAYEKGLKFIEHITDKKLTKKPKDFWQKVLIEMLGVEWNRQKYIIGYKPKSKQIYDIGLNHKVGKKWTSKAMSQEKWKDLEKKLLKFGYNVSWQQGLNDLYEYMDWINSCNLIISSDSLGLHIALTFKKNVIGLFGPTDPEEIYLYKNGKIFCAEQKCEHMPCYYEGCVNDTKCIDSIDLDSVTEAAVNMLTPESCTKINKSPIPPLLKGGLRA